MPPSPAGRSAPPSAVAPLAVRGTPAELDGARRPAADRRSGGAASSCSWTSIAIAIVVNPMLTGRFQLADPTEKHPGKTAVVLGFGPRARGPRDAASWTSGASLDARRRRDPRDPLSRPDPDGQGLPAAGRRRAARGRAWAVTTRVPTRTIRPSRLDVWRDADQAPSRASSRTSSGTRRSSPGSATPTATRSSTRRGSCRSASARAWRPRRWTPCTRRRGRRWRPRSSVLRERVPPTFEKQVRDFLAVHDKGGQPCPRCGTRITEVRAGGFITSYCRGCQR